MARLSIARGDASVAVRQLRQAFGESQPQFAQRLGIALVTLARWETSTPPTGGAQLLTLEGLAKEKGLVEAAQVFADAGRARVTERRRGFRVIRRIDAPKNKQEARYTAALLRVLRNPQDYEGPHRQIVDLLSGPLSDIENALENVATRRGIVRLGNRRMSAAEIADVFDVSPEDVEKVIEEESLSAVVVLTENEEKELVPALAKAVFEGLRPSLQPTSKIDLDRLTRALNNLLAPIERRILSLAFGKKWNLEEIANHENLELGQVKKTQSGALERLTRYSRVGEVRIT